MHMRPQPCQTPIVPSEEAASERLWQRLQPELWPLPLAALPAGSAIVGGAVRDGLLGRLQQRPDLDIVVPQGAVALCRRLARQLGGSAVVLDQERDIARLVLREWTFDLAAWEGDSLEADLSRRDYSINAIALPLQHGAPLLDPCGGRAALERRRLEAISEANLRSDPLRLLRGLRLACELDFALDAHTRALIAALQPHLAEVASERVLAELDKLACAPAGAAGLLQVERSGLLSPWVPAGTTLLSPLAGLDPERAESLGLSGDESSWALPLARMACLADAATLARLRSSRALQKRVQRLRDGLQLLGGRTPAALADDERFALHRNLEADLPALLLLLPDGSDQKALLQRWRDAEDPLCHPRPPLDGERLQELLQRGPGPWLGQLLLQLSQARALGQLTPNASETEVLNLARCLAEAGLQHTPNRRRD